MDIQYLYTYNQKNIEEIVIDKDYVVQNKLFYEIDSSLTNKEIYYFELLDNYII